MSYLGNTAMSETGNHSRGPSVSMSNYSQSGLFRESAADLQLKSVRTQINLFNIDFDAEYNGNIEEEIDEKVNFEEVKQSEDEEEPIPSKPTQKKVTFDERESEMEKKKKQKREEMFKINAEIEFFLLTAIAVKSNLVEEYPDKPEVVTEDAMNLFLVAQKERVVMSKFNLWIEMKLRDKYDLPKLEGFKKFLEKHHVKDKVKTVTNKTKEIGKMIGKKGKKTGQQIGKNVQEFTKKTGERIRAMSKHKDTEKE